MQGTLVTGPMVLVALYVVFLVIVAPVLRAARDGVALGRSAQAAEADDPHGASRVGRAFRLDM